MESKKQETEPQEFDIQHDDEFEDFKVEMKINQGAHATQQVDYLDDWDDDVVENFTEILNEQRRLIQQ